MSLQVGKAIYTLLSSNQQLVSMVDGNIFPLIAEINTTFPFIVYRREAITPQYTKDYWTSDEVMINVMVASNDYVESIEIADLVRQSLDQKKGEYSGITIKDIRLTQADEDFIDDTYIQYLTFKIKI